MGIRLRQAYGMVYTDNGTPTIETGGSGASSVVISGTDLVITLHPPYTGATTYGVTASYCADDNCGVKPHSRTANSFKLAVYDSDTGTKIDPAATDVELMFVACGR